MMQNKDGFVLEVRERSGGQDGCSEDDENRLCNCPRNLPLATFRNYGRYLKGAAIRLARAKTNRAGDLRKEQVFAPFWERYRLASGAENPKKMNRQRLQEFRWLLEEFRISVFAQELHTAVPVSAKRLEAKWLEAEESAQD
jgi:ATP-dependent helicase HrpA